MNPETKFLNDYFADYQRILKSTDVNSEIIEFRDLALKTKLSGGKLIFAGNGASASIASHCALDYTKQAKIPAITFNDPSVITAFSNDCGYDNWILQALDGISSPNDLIILISSSGNSPNVVNAAKYCHEKNLGLVTFTGFGGNNALAKMGQINFFMDSSSYNIIECIHMIWLTMACDLIIGNNEYKPK
jgi:D-sedoheptulose 7-phosphate isomerase